jgi:hypothetical protein
VQVPLGTRGPLSRRGRAFVQDSAPAVRRREADAVPGASRLVFPQFAPSQARGLLEYGGPGGPARPVGKNAVDRPGTGCGVAVTPGGRAGVIDTVSIYEVVAGIRQTPIGKRALLAIVLPAVLPVIPVSAIQIPVKEMLLKLLTTLI